MNRAARLGVANPTCVAAGRSNLPIQGRGELQSNERQSPDNIFGEGLNQRTAFGFEQSHTHDHSGTPELPETSPRNQGIGIAAGGGPVFFFWAGSLAGAPARG